MKPKTKLQKQVVYLSSTMKPITDRQIAWGYQKCFRRYAFVLKTKARCMECGAEWEHGGFKRSKSRFFTICPVCATRLERRPTLDRKDVQLAYCAILTTVGEFQVVRTLFLKQWAGIGKKAMRSWTEVMQHWIRKDGTCLTMSLQTSSSIFIADLWQFDSKMELRSGHSDAANYRRSIVPNRVYPTQKLIPEIKRNGYTGKLYGVSPADLFIALLQSAEIETLVKAGQVQMVRHLLRNGLRVDYLSKGLYWDSVKICLRNGYQIKDPTTWLDYIVLLRRFNKDVLNNHFVCPADLKAAHDHLVKKSEEIERRTALEQKKKQLARDQRAYQKTKGRFFGLVFTSGNLTVKVFESVQEIYLESSKLHHCAFASGYHQKAESLLLSARVDGVPVETVEISLKSLNVVQARGMQNRPSAYNAEIVDLVSRNIPQIKKLLA